MNWTLEVVQIPVTDLDRARDFYARIGFAVDHDTRVPGGPAFVQLTPPGSGCSIVISAGMVDMAPGSQQGLQLVVNDVHAARAHLVECGVEAGPLVVFGQSGPRPPEEGDDLNNVAFVSFRDPDGNGWVVQQITARG